MCNFIFSLVFIFSSACAMEWSKEYKLELDLSNFTSLSSLVMGIEEKMVSISFPNFNFSRQNEKKVKEYRFYDTEDYYFKNLGYVLSTREEQNASKFCVYVKFNSLDYELAYYDKGAIPNSNFSSKERDSKIETNIKLCPQTVAAQSGEVCPKNTASLSLPTIAHYQEFFPSLPHFNSSTRLGFISTFRVIFDYDSVTFDGKDIKYNIGCIYNTLNEALNDTSRPVKCDLSFKCESLNNMWTSKDVPNLRASLSLFQLMGSLIPNLCQVFLLPLFFIMFYLFFTSFF